MPTPQYLMQIGQKLVDYCNAGDWRTCQQQLYAQDATSVEAVPMPDGLRESKGLDAITGKGNWWEGAHEVHSSVAEGPFVHGDDRFSVIFDMDITNRDSGDRTQMREVGQYYVNEAGKITREEFSYPIG